MYIVYLYICAYVYIYTYMERERATQKVRGRGIFDQVWFRPIGCCLSLIHTAERCLLLSTPESLHTRSRPSSIASRSSSRTTRQPLCMEAFPSPRNFHFVFRSRAHWHLASLLRVPPILGQGSTDLHAASGGGGYC